MPSTVESDTLMPSADAAATSSPVADRCDILSDITDVESSILLMLCSATCMLDISTSIVLPTSTNVFSVSSISAFCLSTDNTDSLILSFAFWVSSFSFCMIFVILSEAFLVCSES